MSTQHEPLEPAARPTRTNAEYRWHNGKAHAFLTALAQHGKVAAAARSVGMTRQSAYKLRARVPVVAEGWAQAQAIGRSRRLAGPKATVRRGHGDTSGAAR